MPEMRVKENVEMDFMDVWYPIQVKQTDKVGRLDIDAFETAMQRAKRKLGYFVGFDFTGVLCSKSIGSGARKAARSSR